MTDIKIPKRLYEDIKVWCGANGIDDSEGYILDCIEKQFNLDRYGDLNIIMGIAPPVQQEKQKRKYTRKKKNIDIEPELDLQEETADENNGTIIAGKQDKAASSVTEQMTQEPISGTRKKRVLKSKN